MVGNKLLVDVGRALYGREWHSPMAEALSALEHEVRRWAAGADVPERIGRDLRRPVNKGHSALRDEHGPEAEARREVLTKAAYSLLGPPWLLDNPYAPSAVPS